ncbi:helix-turn-helix domain-containing protein [Nocardia terpenica]|uniref:GbsR/MarR family transcriptional regulator n=1 Tax=Nocardia terpenica TaxID=455432 RepID=UPI002FE37454
MPGGRLTRLDRECIAEGLAAGLDYAEIARQLDRPTSTVSREVARNGGPRRYRADRAQRAAQQRARRPGRNRRSAETATGTQAFEQAPVADVITRLTDLFIRSGEPSTASRILAVLLTTDSGALTTAELTRRLRISPASISVAATRLVNQGLIHREHEGGRRYRYVVDENVWLRSTLGAVHTTEVLSAITHESADLLGATTPAGMRLSEMSLYLDHFARSLLHTAESWRTRATTENEP